MRKFLHLVFGFLLAVLAAGCSTGKEKIWFNSDELIIPPSAPAPVLSQSKKLAREDLFQVQVAVYGHLLQGHFLDDGEYSAVFVQGEDAEVAALIRQFPDHVPPIKPSDQAELRPNRTPLDRRTGKPAMILSVEALDPVNDTVEAIGRWYAGAAVSGYYTFTLRKAGDGWVIVSVQ